MGWAATLESLFMRLCHLKPLLHFPLAQWRASIASLRNRLASMHHIFPCPPRPTTGLLQLLARRIKAAQQLEKQEEAVRGLELLYRRWAGGGTCCWAVACLCLAAAFSG